MTRAVNFTRHKTWGNIARGTSNIDRAYMLNMAFEAFFLTIKRRTHNFIRNSTFNSNSAVTLSFALTDFTYFSFDLDFRQLKTSVFGWNLCLSSTLNFLIAYFSYNDDLVSKIRDHFPNVNYIFEIGEATMHNVSIFVLSYAHVAGYFNKC